MYKLHFIDKIKRGVKKFLMSNCSLCDVILWNMSQFPITTIFCQGVSEKDTGAILQYQIMGTCCILLTELWGM